MTDSPDVRPTRLARRASVPLGLVIVSWGIHAIISQTLLLREAVVLMSGSELAWGLVLFAWLLGVAAGGRLGGFLAGACRKHATCLGLSVVGLSVATGAALWVFRGARAWLSVEQGELLPLAKTALASILFVPPAGVMVGLAFPLACAARQRLTSTKMAGMGPLGNVYALESLGSLVGGAAFSFWAVDNLNPVTTVLCCSALCCMSITLLTIASGGRTVTAGAFGLLSGLSLVVLIGWGDGIDDYLVRRRWNDMARGYRLVAHTDSRLQNLAIGERAGQYTLYCDGKVTADFPDPYTFVPLAHFWMCQHPNPRRVLLAGGGAEGLISEILKHPIKRLDYVEPDPRQVELISPLLPAIDRKALADERVVVHNVDLRHLVKSRIGEFDLVIARLPEPTSAMNARFFTDDFFRELSRAMNDGGVLCMTLAATPADLPERAAEYLAGVRATLRPHFGEVIIGWGDPAHVLIGKKSGVVTINPDELARRYTSRSVQSDMFHSAWFDGATDWLQSDKISFRESELDAIDHAVASTDLRPVVYMQRLALWEESMGSSEQKSGRLIACLRRVTLSRSVVLLLVPSVLLLLLYRLRDRDSGWDAGTLTLSVLTTGFVSMAMSVIWLFAFQNLYGYVYQRIGWIAAIFMGGLVIGCTLMVRTTRYAERDVQSLRSKLATRLIGVDLLLAVTCIAIPIVLTFLAGQQSFQLGLHIVEWSISGMVLLTGLICGAAFAVAGGLSFSQSGSAGQSAGSIVWADHAGACLGALMTGVILVPVLGIAVAAYLLAGLKLFSALLLIWRRTATKVP